MANKIAIAGAGAMGSRIGTYLKQSGQDVTLIDYWKDHVHRINEKGIEVQTEHDTYTVEMHATFPEEVNQTYDIIVLLTKSMQSEQMMQILKEQGAISEDTAILCMMNGLGHDERLSQFVPKSQIFLAVTMWTAGLRGPGQLLLEGEGSIDFQRADGKKDPRTQKIADILNQAHLNATISNDVFKAIWSKATLNSVLNPLCTILDKTIGELGAYDHSRAMIRPIIEEIVDVAHAKNVDIHINDLISKIEAAYPDHAQGLHYPSMHQDYNHGRLTEIDYLNGQIVDYGKSLGIATPNNELITHMIHQLEMKLNINEY